MTRTITIVCREGNDFDIVDGERVCDRLCWDEMLGTIAELTHPRIGQARYRMTDADGIVARIEHRAARSGRILHASGCAAHDGAPCTCGRATFPRAA